MRSAAALVVLGLVALPSPSAADWTPAVELEGAAATDSSQVPFVGPQVAVDATGRAVVLVNPNVEAPLAVHEVREDGALGPAATIPGSERAQEPAITIAGGVITVAWVDHDGSRASVPPVDSGCCDRVHAATWRLGDAPPVATAVSPPRGNVEAGFSAAGGALAWTFTPDQVLASRAGRLRVHVRIGGRTRSFAARRRDTLVRLQDLDAVPGGGVAVTYLRWRGGAARLEQAVLRRRGRGVRRAVLARQANEFGFDETLVAVGGGGQMAAAFRGPSGGILVALGRVARTLGRPRRFAGRGSLYDAQLVLVRSRAFFAWARYRQPPLQVLAGRREVDRVTVRGSEPAAGPPLAVRTGSGEAVVVFPASAGGARTRVEAATVDAAGRVRGERVLGDARAQGGDCRPLDLAGGPADQALALWSCGEERSLTPGVRPSLYVSRRR